ncbi:hypothetical protein CRUP_007005 [Coryphaenoides rupestris]|nr:hypothetical protein CRUP_007005 [Coryphaenoides rupestris]
MSMYRNAVWFVKGLQEYTKSGYEAAAKHFTLGDLDVNVKGRSFVITGANSGIGKQTALEIANRGGTVHMVFVTRIGRQQLRMKSLRQSKISITVSSGGMLVQKLNVDDLQFEKGTFDGTMAYAQNKRQQVILTERWASQHKDIHFSSMHPGWADTPAVRLSMPDFHAKMQNKLRSEAMGADTVVWLAIATTAAQQPSGLFFQDRKAVATHLPLAFSRSSPQDEEKLQATLEQLATKFKP